MTIHCKGNLIDLSAPKVMGILNVTPDSFYDGGKYKDKRNILKQVEKMLTEGSAFIDVGGYSSKPNAVHISVDEELQRILPIVELLVNTFPDIVLSVDTFRSKIARQCVESGAAMINDISAGSLDADMMSTIGELKVPYVMMHMKGTPQTMKSLAEYNNMIGEIQYYFSEKITKARKFGIDDLIIDPGFGFSKTTAHNFELLRKLQLLQFQDVPIVTGISRKSMIYKTLKITPKEAVNGTTSLHTIALLQGASILRVHDVKQAVECIQLVDAYLQ